MKNSDTFRENAENCIHLAERSSSEQTSIRYRRMAEAWTSLAKEQDWLDGTVPTSASKLAEEALDRSSEKSANSDDVKSRKK